MHVHYSREKLKALVLDLVSELDYDLYKSLRPELAEDPEEAKILLETLIDIADRHIN